MPDLELTYRDAGVDIATGNQFVESIKSVAKKTHRPGVLSGIGGFGALFELPLQKYKNPVLVSSTDGVGTKLKLAMELDKHDTVGIDLVAMCVNDIIVQGAEPLFFLDYFATGQLNPHLANQVLTGIAEGCRQANVALIGGETAEMPGMYHGHDYDLAGFAVGIVEKDQIIDGRNIKAGDRMIAIASSGPHSNGFSLIRKILSLKQYDLNMILDNKALSETLLTPTRIYVDTVLQLMNQIQIKAIAHITGGGLVENIPRVLPSHVNAMINRQTWQLPAIFKWLQQQGNIADQEMLTTFNCGIGLVICVAPQYMQPTLKILNDLGEKAWALGEIQKSTQSNPQVVFN